MSYGFFTTKGRGALPETSVRGHSSPISAACQRDPTSVPMDIVQPVEILTALEILRRFDGEEWCQVEDGDSRRAQFTFKAIEIVARPLADWPRIDEERPVHRVFARHEDDQQIE